MASQLTFIRRALYDVKKTHGGPVDLYVQTLSDTDLTTGSKNVTRRKIALAKVPVLPVKFFTQGIYSAGYLKSAKEFSYGAYQEQDVKQFIIDGNDLPVGFEILQDHYFVADHKRYEIAVITRMEMNLGYVVIAKRLTGVEVDEVNDVINYQTIRFTHNVVVSKVTHQLVTQTLTFTQGASH